MKKNLNPIIVVGTGRSGTSAFAGTLHYLNVIMGQEFVPADVNNPLGHWEDVEFTELTRKTASKEIDIDTFKKELLKICERKQSIADEKDLRWGWKIPMTTNLLGPVTEVLPNASYVWIKRDPEESINSCIGAYGWDRDTSEKLIMDRWNTLNDFEKYAKKNDIKLFVYSWKDIIKDPKATIMLVVQDLELDADKDDVLFASDLINNNEKEAKVLIAIPTMGHIHTHLTAHLIKWFKEKNRDFHATVKAVPVDNARNQIVREFLASPKKYTHLLMIDADTIPPVHAVTSLLRSNKDIVSGLTPILRLDHEKKQWYTVMNCFNREKDPDTGEIVSNSYDVEGLRKIDRCGGSCLLIKRDVLEKLNQPWFKIKWEDKEMTKNLGEDFYFCDMAKMAGFDIWANHHVVCQHVKDMIL